MAEEGDKMAERFVEGEREGERWGRREMGELRWALLP